MFYYGVEPTSGNILWKKRSMIPAEGIFSKPEKGLVMYEKIAQGVIPYFQNDAPSAIKTRTSVDLVVKADKSRIMMRISPGPAVPYEISIFSVAGRVLHRHTGYISDCLEIPIKKFGTGRFLLGASVAGVRIDKAITSAGTGSNSLVK